MKNGANVDRVVLDDSLHPTGSQMQKKRTAEFAQDDEEEEIERAYSLHASKVKAKFEQTGDRRMQESVAVSESTINDRDDDDDLIAR